MPQSPYPIAAALLLCLCRAASAQPQSDFFEKKIRPVFVARCQTCHNAATRTASLDLSTAAGFAAGGQSGPIVSKQNPEASRILRAISYEERLKMPPTGKLKPEEIRDIAAWVNMGAPWPNAEAASTQPATPPRAEFTPQQKSFWAFQPVAEVAPPRVRNQEWVRSPVDAFILAKLEEKGLQPAAPASKLALLRRATYDLTGLPPTPQEMQDFVKDESPNAFEKVVDRLLASPRYGERWGRHWLDVARYADSTGNDEDHRYPYGWRYRDYVIAAFNDDKPYDRFILEQLAGDQLPAPQGQEVNREGLIATGFLALGAKALAQKDKQKMLYDIYDEQVDVTSRAFMGLTLSCARCHNHKFDPILTRDYYSLVGMFASTKAFSDPHAGVGKLLFVPLVSKEKYEIYSAQQERVRRLKDEMADLAETELEQRARTAGALLASYMLTARRVQPDLSNAAQLARDQGLDAGLLTKWSQYLRDRSQDRPHLADWDKADERNAAEIARDYQAKFQEQFDKWTGGLKKWREEARQAKDKNMPPPERPKFDPASDMFFYEVYFKRGPLAVSTKEREKLLPAGTREKIASISRELAELKANAAPEPDMACAVVDGEPVNQKVFIRGDYANPGEDAPKTFPRILAKPTDPKVTTGSGRRELAEWLSNPEHPLTARVMVNRIWQWHFGEGIVRTPDNFGRMGDRPSNPELLDYLAKRFVDGGWSVKKMHRMIMLSSAYRMSSEGDSKSITADPENLLLSRFNRQRLDVEEIRDGLLAIDGSLDLTTGGSLQTGFGTDKENSAGRLSLDPLKVKRRTVYLPLRRANLPTLLNLFDFGDATTPNGKRALTNIAPQALFAMNSEFMYEHSRNLAEQLLGAGATGPERIETAYERILNRNATPDEVDAALSYVRGVEEKFGKPPLDAWQSFCHILMSSNEFVYLD